MCKCLQYCLESCYWHLIEKRFCYDESIALYEVPRKEEKNNNMFDNLAFYDCVSVIAGRAVVTIDPVPPEEKPIVQQPTRRLRWEAKLTGDIKSQHNISRSVPTICRPDDSDKENEERPSFVPYQKKVTMAPIPDDDVDATTKRDKTVNDQNTLQTLHVEYLDPEIKRKSLRERRMSKSLYLKIDQPKELPLIRQQSMPKFYLDTPDVNPTFVHRSPSTALTSPVPINSSGFVYDLYSVVQIENERAHQYIGSSAVDKHSRLAQIKEKIKLKRTKSGQNIPINLPHSHQHI